MTVVCTDRISNLNFGFTKRRMHNTLFWSSGKLYLEISARLHMCIDRQELYPPLYNTIALLPNCAYKE